MTKKDESISSEEIAHVVRVLVGPEEDWDEADGEFAMKLYGIEPAGSTKETCDLVLGAIQKFRERREEVPSGLINILTQLASKLKKEEPFVSVALGDIKQRLSEKQSKGLAVAAVNKRFRGKEQLSETDEKILKNLSDELLSKEQDEN